MPVGVDLYLEPLASQTWYEAIIFGALLAALSAALLMGVSRWILQLSALRLARRTFAMRLRFEIRELGEILRQDSTQHGIRTASAFLDEANDLFLLSQLFLPTHDARILVDFYETARNLLARTDLDSSESGRSVGSRGRTELLTVVHPLTMSVLHDLLRASEKPLTCLKKY